MGNFILNIQLIFEYFIEIIDMNSVLVQFVCFLRQSLKGV